MEGKGLAVMDFGVCIAMFKYFYKQGLSLGRCESLRVFRGVCSIERTARSVWSWLLVTADGL